VRWASLVFKPWCSSVTKFWVKGSQTGYFELLGGGGAKRVPRTTSRRARHVSLAVVPQARTPMHPRDCRSEAVHRGHCTPKGGDTRPPPMSVPHGCRAHAGAHTALLHWPPPVCTSPTASPPMPWPMWPLVVVEPPSSRARAYNPPLFVLVRASSSPPSVTHKRRKALPQPPPELPHPHMA
jgi:hypothetical protein